MATKSKYKLILFDGDDTLYRVRGSVGLIYSEELHKFGLAVSANEIDRLLPSVWKDFEQDYLNQSGQHETSAEAEQQRWFQFVQKLLTALKLDLDKEAFFRAIYDQFSRGDSRVLAPGVKEILTQLRADGLATGLLTNNDRRVLRAVNELGLEPLLDHFLISADLGFKKPSRNCFEIAASRAETAGDEIIYVGDSLELDYFAAKAAGWDAIWFNWKNKPQPEGVVTIRNLSELQALL